MNSNSTDSNFAEIPNIDIGQAYDQHYLDEDIHYENLDRLANFFGRNMPVHYHDRFYQIHTILDGTVHVHIEETSYTVECPMFFLTPPTVPHAFVTDNNATGHVITARQQLMWELMENLSSSNWNTLRNTHLCVSLCPDKDAHAARMLALLEIMSRVVRDNNSEHALELQSLLQLLLIDINRLASQNQKQQKTRKEDVRIFHRYNELIEAHFRQHLTLTQYAEKINVTEARLNEICRRLSGLPSKQLIMERLIQEAKRLLSFSCAPVSEISYQLGFKDPAYFARFFRRNTGVTASKFRGNG